MRTFNLHKNSGRAITILLFSSCAAMTGFATSEGYTPPPFDHYQSILDRMPFGALPPDFNATPVDAAAAKTEEQVKADQQKLAKQVNMSAVNVTPDGGTAIGFTDLSEKPPINYYLLVGAEAGGWKVVSADYDDEQATIEKDGISITLKLGKGLVDPAAAQPGKPGTPGAPGTAMAASGLRRPALSPQVPGGRPSLLSRGGIALPSSRPAYMPQGLVHGGGSFAERLQERQQQEAQARQAADQKQREQFEELARQAAAKEIQRQREAETTQADANAAQLPNDAPQGAPQQEVQ